MEHPIPPPRWQRRKEARPSEITAAALALFVQRGFSATKLDDVAKAAGITKGTLYLYFASKEELFKAAVRDTWEPSLQLAEEMIADTQHDATSLLETLLLSWIDLIQASPANGISKLAIAEAGNFPELAQFYQQEIVDRSRRIFGKVIERGMQRGEFRQVDIGFMVTEIISPIIMQTLWQQAFGPYCKTSPDLPGFARFHLDLLLNGLRTASAHQHI
ncbi:TetR/AcrR family transcriptional regulator [Chitinivorax sp. B]|uniref:TetR/AcrR family transcriptional regulator n=1 Tax=Chitinivorax sp. B TaxID=2502235 RepID=UPI0010F7F1D2|nr:TetR/AcrR family transcriptional regulator [Chitinivorax sp. B]